MPKLLFLEEEKVNYNHSLTLILCSRETLVPANLTVTVRNHENAMVSRASFVMRIEKLELFGPASEQSWVNKYLHEPWKLYIFPSNVL